MTMRALSFCKALGLYPDILGLFFVWGVSSRNVRLWGLRPGAWGFRFLASGQSCLPGPAALTVPIVPRLSRFGAPQRAQGRVPYPAEEVPGMLWEKYQK